MRSDENEEVMLAPLTDLQSDYHLYSVAEFVDRPELSAGDVQAMDERTPRQPGRTLEHGGGLLHYEADRNSARGIKR